MSTFGSAVRTRVPGEVVVSEDHSSLAAVASLVVASESGRVQVSRQRMKLYEVEFFALDHQVLSLEARAVVAEVTDLILRFSGSSDQ